MSDDLVLRWLLRASEAVHADRQLLTDLDAAIGDGDHGINLDRGFRQVSGLLLEGAADSRSAADVLALAGRTIMGTVGGASGALYGRAFLRAGQRLDGIATGAGPVERAVLALDAFIESVATLGRSEAGQKTMLDALVPGLASLRSSAAAGLPLPAALDAAARAAEAGAEATIPMLALRGRASYLGERSVGHRDPGATSSAILLRALATAACHDPHGADGTAPTDERYVAESGHNEER